MAGKIVFLDYFSYILGVYCTRAVNIINSGGQNAVDTVHISRSSNSGECIAGFGCFESNAGPGSEWHVAGKRGGFHRRGGKRRKGDDHRNEDWSGARHHHQCQRQLRAPGSPARRVRGRNRASGIQEGDATQCGGRGQQHGSGQSPVGSGRSQRNRRGHGRFAFTANGSRRCRPQDGGSTSYRASSGHEPQLPKPVEPCARHHARPS